MSQKTKSALVIYMVRFLLVIILGAAYAMIVHADVAGSTTTLSMDGAISQAIRTNLTTALAKAQTLEAQGRVVQAAASLLPQVTGSVAQSRVFKANFAAEGFESSPLLPNPVVGPYNVFDARFQLVQTLLDMNSIWNTKSASANARAARLAEELAAEQVASAAALSYIEDLRALRSVQDASSNLDLAQRLSALAHHQHDAGLANGVDVARADTRVSQDRQRLIQTQLAALQADIRLKRVVGIPFEETLVLSINSSSPVVVSGGSMVRQTFGGDASINQALQDRLEIRITREQVDAENYALSAARAGFLPVIALDADYGFSGNLPSGSARTGSIGGRLNLPIFSGGQTHGDIEEAKGRRSEALSRYDDIRLQVEEDVRLALQTLSAETDEVATVETQVALAERELKLAEDRYSAGVGDNIQVVTAQTSVEDARLSRVDVQARYADARANLAVSLGHMRQFIL